MRCTLRLLLRKTGDSRPTQQQQQTQVSGLLAQRWVGPQDAWQRTIQTIAMHTKATDTASFARADPRVQHVPHNRFVDTSDSSAPAAPRQGRPARPRPPGMLQTDLPCIAVCIRRAVYVWVESVCD